MGSLDYRALAVLDAVASQGSFEKAALALGISQPAVVSDQDMMNGFLHTVLELNGPYPHHTMPQSAATAECIYGSLAYGLMPQIQVSGALAADRLVDLAPGHHIDVALNWHAWNLDTPFTRALTEQIVATAQRFLL